MKKSLLLSIFFGLLSNFAVVSTAHAQVEPYIGQVGWFGFNFCPTGWAEANGQLIPININSALFSLLGTQYGGDGLNTFGLPDLRGRFVMGDRQGPGLSNRVMGQVSGSESTSLSVNQLPSHSHGLTASSSPATKTGPSGNYLAASGTFRKNETSPVTLGSATIEATGGNQPVGIMPPFVVMKACIATQGVYPQRP